MVTKLNLVNKYIIKESPEFEFDFIGNYCEKNNESMITIEIESFGNFFDDVSKKLQKKIKPIEMWNNGSGSQKDIYTLVYIADIPKNVKAGIGHSGYKNYDMFDTEGEKIKMSNYFQNSSDKKIYKCFDCEQNDIFIFKYKDLNFYLNEIDNFKIFFFYFSFVKDLPILNEENKFDFVDRFSNPFNDLTFLSGTLSKYIEYYDEGEFVDRYGYTNLTCYRGKCKCEYKCKCGDCDCKSYNCGCNLVCYYDDDCKYAGYEKVSEASDSEASDSASNEWEINIKDTYNFKSLKCENHITEERFKEKNTDSCRNIKDLNKIIPFIFLDRKYIVNQEKLGEGKILAEPESDVESEVESEVESDVEATGDKNNPLEKIDDERNVVYEYTFPNITKVIDDYEIIKSNESSYYVKETNLNLNRKLIDEIITFVKDNIESVQFNSTNYFYAKDNAVYVRNYNFIVAVKSKYLFKDISAKIIQRSFKENIYNPDNFLVSQYGKQKIENFYSNFKETDS